MGFPPLGAMPIASSAQAQLGERYRFIEGRQRARVRRGAGWQEDAWLPANPADPSNVNAQGVFPADTRTSGLYQMDNNSGPTVLPFVVFQIDVPTDDTLVLWHATARVWGCGLFYMQSPTWLAEYGLPQQQAFNTMFGPGLTSSNHLIAAWAGHKYGQGRFMDNQNGPGWPVPLTGATYVYPKKTAGVFELGMSWQTGLCGLHSFLWDIRISATVLP